MPDGSRSGSGISVMAPGEPVFGVAECLVEVADSLSESGDLVGGFVANVEGFEFLPGVFVAHVVDAQSFDEVAIVEVHSASPHEATGWKVADAPHATTSQTCTSPVPS
jgi:hypothetical protein